MSAVNQRSLVALMAPPVPAPAFAMVERAPVDIHAIVQQFQDSATQMREQIRGMDARLTMGERAVIKLEQDLALEQSQKRALHEELTQQSGRLAQVLADMDIG